MALLTQPQSRRQRQTDDMKRLLLLLPLLLSACGAPMDYLRCNAMTRAKARIEDRLRDAVSDSVASEDLSKVNSDWKTEGFFKALDPPVSLAVVARATA